GRWAMLHRACARALLAGGRASGLAERIGRHLAAAGDGLEAAPHLWRAAKERLAICDYGEVHALSALRDAGLAAAGVEEREPSRARGMLMRAESAASQGMLDECARWVDRVAALGSDDDDVLGEIAERRG